MIDLIYIFPYNFLVHHYLKIPIQTPIILMLFIPISSLKDIFVKIQLLALKAQTSIIQLFIYYTIISITNNLRD